MNWFFRILHRRRRDRDLAREIAAHFNEERAENIARGMTPEEADRLARIKFGSARRVHEDLWQQNSVAPFENLTRDLRYTIRTLARTPGFTLTAILVTALGIGATTALFTVVHSVLLNPLPYPQSSRLVSLYESDLTGGTSPTPWDPVAGGVFHEWQKATRNTAEMALTSPWQGYNVSAGGGQLPEAVSAALVSWNLFRVLGAAPALGRDFLASDDKPSAQATVILSNAFWKRRFAADPAIVGKSVYLDARPYTVIGVMPASFAWNFNAKTQLWTAAGHEAPRLMNIFEDHEFLVVARLAPGATLAGLVSQIDTVQRNIKLAHPGPSVHTRAIGRPLLDSIVEDFKTPLYALLAATICVLLIACLNVANLLVARSAARQKDLAIRAALGGSRWRLIREHLTESLVLSATGGILGLLLAMAALAWLGHSKVALARSTEIHLDLWALVFVIAISTITGLVAGLIPSLGLHAGQLLESLQSTSRSHSGGRGRAQLRKALLTAEVGLTVVLLLGAGLLLKSYQQLRTRDLGCTVDNVLTFHVNLPDVRYKEPTQKNAFFEQLLARVRALPGVQAAGVSTALPGEGWGGDNIASIVEHPPLPKGQGIDLMHRNVDPGYFAALQIPLLRGRYFRNDERLDRTRVVIISESTAKKYFSGEDPVGRHLNIDFESPQPRPYEIVGVVGDTRWNITDSVRPTFYAPLLSGNPNYAGLAVRGNSNVDVESLALPIQKIFGQLDPDLPVADVMTMRQNIGVSTLQDQFNSILVLAFAIIALVLAAVGLYGVLSYLVTQRTGELGIRIALGAQRAEVMRLTLADGLAPVLIGLVIGLAGGAATVQLLRTMLYGMSPFDWSVFSTVVLVLAITAACACIIPAWRASRLDPHKPCVPSKENTMNWLRFFRRRRSDLDLAREIAAHLNEERAENLARGLSSEEAERLARIKFGSARRVHEDLWYQNSLAAFEGILRDLKYALRSLAHAPGFALTVILIMALGIGANTAVFSVMNAVLLKSLPVADPQRVFYLYIDGQPDGGSNSGNGDSSFSYPVYDALRHQDRSLSEVIAYVPLTAGGKTAVRFGNNPEEAEGDMVGGNFFSGLGVRMARGRGFSSDDETQHAPIAVISYNYWTRRFSRAPDVLGSTLYVKGVPLTIVGISVEGFEGTEPGDSVDFWIPLQSRPELNAWGDPAPDGQTYLTRQNWWCLRILARLAPGISQKQALAQTQTILAQAAFIGLGRPHAGQKPPVLSFQPAKAFPGYEDQYGMPLKMMMAMVALVLLIALSNVIMLILARSANRQREFSVRLSLGAGRTQLFRQLLTESALLVLFGGSLAWLFACAGTRSLAAWAQIDSSLSPDATALSVTLGILVLAAFLFGIAPLRTSLAGGTSLVLKSASAVTNQNAGGSRSTRIVIALQMAFCLSLLVGAGLLVRTLRNLQNTPLGMRTTGLVVFGINPQQTHTLDEGVAFYQQLLTRLRALPGVESVSFAENRPGSGWSSNNGAPMIDGHKPPNSDGEQGIVRMNNVGSDFFHTLGTPILAGRDFTDADTAHSANVVIVNQTFAQRFLPNQNPVGHSIGDLAWVHHAQIVGVVKDHKYTGITEHTIPMLWKPYTQNDRLGELHVEMRVQGDPLAILPAAQNAVRQIDPNLPLLQPMLQQVQFDRSISQQILFARLAECFGLLAIVLVATGIYGTLAYRVSRRTAEIGVRMALGARRGQVVWMILRSTLWLTLIGVLVGAPLAILISRTLASSLYNVKPFDAASYLAAVLCLVLVSLIASAIPAQRAARLDPAKALRTE